MCLLHIDANGVEVQLAARKEAHNAAVVLHWDAERCRSISWVPKRPICPDVGDDGKGPNDVVELAVRANCSRNFLHKLRRAKFDLRYKNNI